MIKRSFRDDNGATWERITKPAAIKAYINGKNILIIAENLRPFAPWHNEFITTRTAEADADALKDFITTYNSFTYYNCINTETGRRPAFYVKTA